MREIKFEVITNNGIRAKVPAPSFSLAFHDTGATLQLWASDWLIDELPVKHIRQYTGLKDKRGREIYEGDLLRIPAKDQFEETTFNCFEVFYHDNECIGGQNIGFCMNRMHPQGSSAGGYGYKFTPESIHRHGFEVIGDIHENHDLLRKATENVN